MKIVENRKKFFAASLIVIIIGFAAMIFNAQAGRGAFQYDVEFTGGTSFDLDLGQEYKQEDLQKIITDVTGQDSPQIQQVIGTNEVTVKIQSIDSATRETLTNAILEAYPNAVMGEVNDVSGTVSHEQQPSKQHSLRQWQCCCIFPCGSTISAPVAVLSLRCFTTYSSF